MPSAIVQTDLGVTLLGAGKANRRLVDFALSVAPILVAADGGANLALKMGRMPEAVIGDLDSISPAEQTQIPQGKLHRIADQQDTDLDKCLARIKAPFVVIAGVSGRADHHLAALSALLRAPERALMLLSDDDVLMHCPARVAVGLPAGTRVSLYPMAPVRGRSEGLRWPIEGIAFDPAARIGTSNAALGNVTLAFDGPGMLIILPRRHLPALLAARLRAG